ncbi:chloride channel protein [Coleofasciculus sp. FACHB-SPT9]|uniref:chloride channel protein n=1 Tax=Cyanophyceae TaxID=3028117 RepID=UPI0016892FCF|nr:chloride channel protein [Coleofasciculus sp. FACHB-SPT9]MBD1888498.1 chloride channel protein [Coleofasciculus sp. FACHB-SPT9]
MSATPLSDVLLAESSAPTSPASRLTKILNRLEPSPESVVLLLAVLIGTGTGMGVVTFHYLIAVIHSLMLEGVMGIIGGWGAWTLACIPILGGLIVGLMRLAWPDFGPNISSLIAAAQGVRELLPLRPVTKMVAAAVSLGSGASLGPEGPSVEIGGNFGMLLGQVLQVSRERQQLLLGAGAAAGLAAGFNAPIAGVFFALEVVLGTTFATSAVSVVLLAAVVASLIAQIGLGAQPAFTLPVYEVRSPLELPLYLGLGVLASLVSLTYTQSIQLARSFFRGQIAGFEWLGKIPRSLCPIIGGACLGLVALQWPQILGIGYETIAAMLQDVDFPLGLLLVLLVVKLIVTAISLGSGLVGGIFAPAMFLGASLGAAYGKILAAMLPGAPIQIAAPPAYAMVGMAAVLAGSARAPLTAILLMFELTRDYRIVLPLMAAVGLSIWLVERFKSAPTKGQNLQQLELNVEKDQQLEILQQMLVAEAMQVPGLMLSGSLSVLEAGLALTNGRCRSALVIDDAEQLIGIVTLQDINRAMSTARTPVTAPTETVETNNVLCNVSNNLTSHLAYQPVADICTTEILYANPDESVAEAIDRMAARGLHQLPVVDRDRPQQVLGVLEQEGIALAYSVAATRKTLRRYLPLNPVSKELNLPPLKQTV